jgi:excisionase family DNA binding protein
MTKLLKVKDVADRLSIGVSTAYRLIEEGQIRFTRVGSGRGTIRVRPEDLERYINRPLAVRTLVPASESLFV